MLLSFLVFCLTTVAHKDTDGIVIALMIIVFNPSSAVYLFCVQEELDLCLFDIRKIEITMLLCLAGLLER